MSPDTLDALLRRFRRQLAKGQALRMVMVAAVAVGITWELWFPGPRSTTMLVFAGVLVAWVTLAVGTVQVSRGLQTGRALLMAGQLDNAELWLRRTMTALSISPNPQLMAGQQLASLFFRRDAHSKVVAVCQELLRHRLRRLRHVWINTRLMLADSLLMLDRTNEAYEAMRPVYDVPLSLADRMKLLPIQLRYELAEDHSASAVRALAEKMRIAELLDSQRAALVHALLAEACRRQAMPSQCEFLTQRARLYWDLGTLVGRYAVIASIAGISPAVQGEDVSQTETQQPESSASE